MRKLVPLFLLLAVLPLVSPAQRRRPPAPKRVEIVEQKSSPVTYGVAVERYVSSYTIRADGTARQTLEIQQKCTRETCVEGMKKIEQVYNADLQKAKLIEAYLIRKDGTRVEVSKDNGITRPTPQAESAPEFSSLNQIEVTFPEYKIGDSIFYKFEIETTKPVFSKHFDSLELFPALIEWGSIEVSVTAPSDLPLFFDTTGLTGGEVASTDRTSKSWRWKSAGISAIPIETAMVDTQRSSARFAATTFSSFEQLGQVFGDGVREKAAVTPEVRALAEEVTKDLKDPSDQAAAIYQWVNKNIRYLLVVLDRGGWVPHSTEQILKNRYGDCKDYTTLIYAMLKAKGIESVPVLINARFGNWFPKVATMEHFDHAILYIPSLKLFADATSPNTRLGQLPQPLVGKTALQAGEKPGLISVPQDRPDDNQVLSDVDVEILADGTLRSKSSNVFAGRSEIIFRPLFSDAKRTGFTDSLVKLQLAYFGLTGAGRVVDISDPHSVADPFSIKIEVEIPDFATLTQKGSLAIPAGINTISMASLEAYTKEERRATDLYTGATRIRERFNISVPANVTFLEMPAPVKFENSVGRFEVVISKTPSGVELRRELVLLKDAIEPTEYPAFKELIAATVSGMNASVPYTANGSPAAKRRPAGSKPTPRKPADKGLESVMSEMLVGRDQKLPIAEVRRLEARVKVQPTDFEARRKLLSHYSSYDVKETPATIRARTEHKLWIIRNQPEKATSRLLGWFYFDEEPSAEYVTLRDEWKKQIAAKPTDFRVWLNAADMTEYSEPDLAEDILAGGKKEFPNSYEFPFELSLLQAGRLNRIRTPLTPERKTELTKRSIANCNEALVLLKKERSQTRDSDRGRLLLKLAPVAIDAGELDLAESLARELILDFGRETTSSNFEEASHTGNTVLGKVALARNDITKATEHLLISIRAPLRRPDGYFYEVDLSLANQLFKKGEKKAVSEFLSSALKISGYVENPDTNKDEIAALKKWISEIDKGLEPTFDFDKP